MAISHNRVYIGLKINIYPITILYVDPSFDDRSRMWSYIPNREAYAKPIRRW